MLKEEIVNYLFLAQFLEYVIFILNPPSLILSYNDHIAPEYQLKAH